RDESLESLEASRRGNTAASLSRLETSSALTSRRGDARWRRLDVLPAPLADWDQGATGERSTRARALNLPDRFWPVPGAGGGARAGPGRGDGMVGGMEPADLGNGADPPA